MPTAEQFITESLDLWSSAVKTKSSAGRGGGKKRELYGIKKLRELILELAVSGLLVPQDPNDEPASELIKKIAKEKAKLIKEGKIKKQKQPAPIAENEKPLASPRGWTWARFQTLPISYSVGLDRGKSQQGSGLGYRYFKMNKASPGQALDFVA